ncbi:hypothetical protein [Aureimonas sp. AU12]|uniref:hypothetical protein n=1 Tax=Aureimonas sp. AU12 TaxID=1638161 RepID=UPI0009E67801|nr:hypothetical protein [Aureimonas sp. AU12]
MRVLLSINPVHVRKILDGVKIFEFRKKIFSRKDVRKILIYSTKPVAKIVGEFSIDRIIQDSPEALWETTYAGSGISKDFFDSYFAGRQLGYALQIGFVQEFDSPLDPDEMFPNFTPPQSFMYVPSVQPAKHNEFQQLSLL